MSLQQKYLRDQLQKLETASEPLPPEFYYKRAMKLLHPDDRKILTRTLSNDKPSPPQTQDNLLEEHKTVEAAIRSAWWCLEQAEKLYEEPHYKAVCQFEQGILLFRLLQKNTMLPYLLAPESKAALLKNLGDSPVKLTRAAVLFQQSSENGCVLADFMLVRGLLMLMQQDFSSLKKETFQGWITQRAKEHLLLARQDRALNLVLSQCEISRTAYEAAQEKLLAKFDPTSLNLLLLSHPPLSACLKQILPTLIPINRAFHYVWHEALALRTGTKMARRLPKEPAPEEAMARSHSSPVAYSFLRPKKAKTKVGSQPEPGAEAERYFVRPKKRPPERDSADQDEGVKKSHVDTRKF